jgi:uncharacterized membrane protein
MFELLFKYPYALYAKGEFHLLSAWPRSLLAALIVLAAAALAAMLITRARAAPLRNPVRIAALWLLETALAVLVLVLLWQPAVAVSELEPRQNIVAIAVDDSRSMAQVEQGETREARAIRALRSGALAGLQQDFQIRLYRLDTHITRVDRIDELGPPSASATHIGASLTQLMDETAGLPVGAVVLLSDGGDNSGGIDRDAIAALRARRIPVYTVGFGAATLAPDVELGDVSVTPRALAGARLSATVKFRQSGYTGQKSRLVVRDGTKLLAARDVVFGAAERMQSEDILFDIGTGGAQSIEFAIEPLAGEVNRANNALVRLINVDPQPRRILYFEGEPRWEYKFIRRAAEADRWIHLVSMLRTTENKIYRQGVEDAHELADGFPSRPEELFAYQAIIIGSVDAGYFTPDQQSLLRDFVDRRGGGLLLLGGRESLADGVWSGSRVAETLPVTLPLAHDTFHRDHATVSLTPAGAQSVICRLLDDPAANLQRWRTLPYLMDYQDPGTPKPGALVLAEMHYGGRTMPLLITQRFGRGRTAVLATGGTWRWQMSLPLGERSHDVFWQQLLRWLAADTRGPVSVAVDRPQLFDEGSISLEADVRDKLFTPAADARIAAHLIGPRGLTRTIELDPVRNAPGQFRSSWAPPVAGNYIAEVTAQRGNEEIGRDVATFQRLDGLAENLHLEQQRALLEELAASTGGRYLQASQLASLARSIPYSQAGITVRQIKELWSVPAVFLLLLSLRLGEWLLRRKWGVL